MKTSVSTGRVSLSPAQAAGWGVKIGKEMVEALKNPVLSSKNGLQNKGMRA